MINWILSKLNLEATSPKDADYIDCIRDLIDHDAVQSMKNYIQHSDTHCLDHSLFVSYMGYLICRRMGLDWRSAARGGLLHDFYLYDWHDARPDKGLHGFTHPRIALKNANKEFDLSDIEQDIIEKHMWPLTISVPKYWETVVMICIDKYCACMEIFKLGKRKNLLRIQKLLAC